MDDCLWILKRSASFVAVQATEALASSRAVLLCSADSVSLGAYGNGSQFEMGKGRPGQEVTLVQPSRKTEKKPIAR